MQHHEPHEPENPRRDAIDERPWVVVKFGGTSVASPRRWRSIAEIVRGHRDAGRRVLMVCSAVGSTSDQLEGLIADASAGRPLEPGLAALAQVHAELGAALGVDAAALIKGELEDLGRLLEGARMIGEAPPRLRARLFSAGELMATRIGAASLIREGIDASWEDARRLLKAAARRGRPSPEAHYLSATCAYDYDPVLRQRLGACAADVVITQGFIASDDEGATVLLGRGGSDTSAAYFAARLGADRLEIWTDVPGMFTTNPRDEPRARLLPTLSYGEAEALANLGARVLHPRCIAPARARGIPIRVRCTDRPALPGTEIVAAEVAGDGCGPRAVSLRSGLALLSMRRDPSWQPVGFLADVTACFKRHGLSIDLLSTSPAEIKATIHRAAAPSLDRLLPALVADLEAVAEVDVVAEVASVSLVGRGIRQALHSLGGALDQLADREIHMVTQGSDDLHLTLVVDAEHGDELARRLHDALLVGEGEGEGDGLGATWAELTGADPAPAAASRRPPGGGASVEASVRARGGLL
jgi:diaminopimelate decarboxylase/aspartate kinase